MEDSNTIWIIDTCAILKVKELTHGQERKKAFERLTVLVESGVLFFPDEVFRELEKGKRTRGPDAAFEWGKSVKHVAANFPLPQEQLKLVMSHPIASKVCDVEKQGEEADPVIIALALYLQDEFPRETIKVITEDRKDRPDKKSLVTACGVMGVIAIPTEDFLTLAGILPT